MPKFSQTTISPSACYKRLRFVQSRLGVPFARRCQTAAEAVGTALAEGAPDAIEAALPPGVFVSGSPYRGIGIPDCVHQGQTTAQHVVSYVMQKKDSVSV